MRIFSFFLSCFLITSASFAQKSFNIKNYGAIGNGKVICTKALQIAVNACNKNGGGDVVIPPGVFVIGTVHLKK